MTDETRAPQEQRASITTDIAIIRDMLDNTTMTLAYRQALERLLRSLSGAGVPREPSVRHIVEGWLPDAVDAQYEKLYALVGDHIDADIRCAAANLRNANRIIREVMAAAQQREHDEDHPCPFCAIDALTDAFPRGSLHWGPESRDGNGIWWQVEGETATESYSDEGHDLIETINRVVALRNTSEVK